MLPRNSKAGYVVSLCQTADLKQVGRGDMNSWIDGIRCLMNIYCIWSMPKTEMLVAKWKDHVTPDEKV